jgi:hypothetical protein
VPVFKVAAVVHFKPSGEVSTKYFRIALVLLFFDGTQAIFAVVGLITKETIVGAAAAGCGVAETDADDGPVPIWLTASTLKK